MLPLRGDGSIQRVVVHDEIVDPIPEEVRVQAGSDDRAILARFEMGFQVPEPESGEVGGYHCWVEFYLPATG